MSYKIKKILLIALTLCFVCCFASACSLGPSLEKEKERYNLTASVTYHANGGEFNNNSDVGTMWYSKPYVYAVGLQISASGTFTVSYDNHTLEGWYFAKTDDNGEIVYTDKENGIVALGEKFNFDTYRLSEGEDLHLYAHWIRNQVLEVLLASDDSIKDKLVYKDKTYNAGDIIKEYKFGTTQKIEEPKMDLFTGKPSSVSSPDGYVFAEFYKDADCTQKVTWPIEATGEEENVKIYAKYLSDEWKVISKSSELYQMFTGVKVDDKTVVNGKFFIKNNIVADLNESVASTPDIEFSGVIQGNGYTISGLTLRQVQVDKPGSNFSLFGNITDNAIISDLTVKDFTWEYTAKNNKTEFNAYFIYNGISEKAKVSNLVIDGGSMKINTKGGNFNGKELSSIAKDYLPIAPSSLPSGITVSNNPTIKIV